VSDTSNPKKRLLSQAAADSTASGGGEEVEAVPSSPSLAAAASSLSMSSSSSSKRAHVEPRSEAKSEAAAELQALPQRIGVFQSGEELAQYTAAFQNKALLAQLRSKKQELAAAQQRARDAERKLSAAESTAAHVHLAWTALQGDLRVVLLRLGESSAEQSRRTAAHAVQGVSSFRRLLHSSSQLLAHDNDDSAPADLAAHLRQRKAEASQLLLAVVEAVERGGAKSNDSSALVDELQTQLSGERDRSTALADKLAQAELQLADATALAAQLRDDLAQAQAQRERARTTLRTYQAATLAASQAARSSGGTAAQAAAAAAQLAVDAAQAGVSNEELDELRQSLAVAERKAADRLAEIEKLRHSYQQLEDYMQKERVELVAPMPERVAERSELFGKLRLKLEQTGALLAEKAGECERLQKALADAEQARVAGLARVEQQHRAALDELVEKLRDSETTLQRVRGERRAVALKAAELDVELAKAREGTAIKDKYLETLNRYARALTARAVLPRLRADVAGVVGTVSAAAAAALSSAASGVDAGTATTSALDQAVAAGELAALQSELSALRAQAVLWQAQQAAPTADEQRAELARQLGEARAHLASAEETHRVLEGELDSLCKAVDESTTELRESVAVISAKDDMNLQLMTDKAKMRTALQSSKEATLIKQAQLDKLEAALYKQKASFDAKVEELRHAGELLEQRRLLIVELEKARDAAAAVELRRIEDDTVAKARLDATAKQVAEAQRLIQDNVAAIHELSGKLARQKEETNHFKRSWEAARNLNRGGNSEQVAFWREKCICKVCLEREKTTVLSKCWHTFCGECVEQNLRDRHRKCPKCGAKFGEQDVHILF
jgi:E3 ubiquitin-protein ligase BRE1